MNLYAYVDNEPLRFIDPFGLDKNNKKGCATSTQSTTITNISIGNSDDGTPTLNVDMKTKGFPPDSTVSVDVKTGRLRSDHNPAGPNMVVFTPLGSGTGKVGPDGSATAQIPLNGLQQGQYMQIIPQRLNAPVAPVITPEVDNLGKVKRSKKVDPQENYPSGCQ